ncbi:hypothetical protein AAV80_11690 [Salmonella enterica subsp. enterica serovar Kentucky]|nr:hypothetical protein [Salmonella enterica subsp. enterica serovar Kentucky]
MHSDNIFTLENVQKALAACDYELLNNTPIGWCIDHVQQLQPADITAALDYVNALDLIHSSPEIVRGLCHPTSDIWQFINISADTAIRIAVAAVALTGACRPFGEDAQTTQAILLLAGKAILQHTRATEILADFEDLQQAENSKKRAMLGGHAKNERRYAALRNQCQAWADEVIAMFDQRNRTLTKAELARQVDKRYANLDPGSSLYLRLHPNQMGRVEYRTIYGWVSHKTIGQRHNHQH